MMPHMDPASLRAADSGTATPPSSHRASPASLKAKPKAGTREAPRRSPKGKPQGKAANFKQQKDAKLSALAESPNNKQHKESHKVEPHGKKKVYFRDLPPATSESGRQCHQRDKERHHTMRIHNYDPSYNDDPSYDGDLSSCCSSQTLFNGAQG